MAEVKARRQWRVPTGQFIRNYLLANGEAHPSEIHKALHLEYDKINQGRKPRNPPQVNIPWGRGASDYRPGLFTKKYLKAWGSLRC